MAVTKFQKTWKENRPYGNSRNLDDIDFGSKFVQSIPSLDSKRRAFNFLCKIVSELEKRAVNSKETVQKIAFAKPVKVLDMVLRLSFATFPTNIFKTDEAEQEYRNLVDYKWTDKCDLSTIKRAEF